MQMFDNIKIYLSQDSRVAIKACEGLLLCSSIKEDQAASVMVLYTTFCEKMVRPIFNLRCKTFSWQEGEPNIQQKPA